MTYEEAIKIVKCQALNNPDYPLVCEAMNMAIEALEKQIPKKAEIRRVRHPVYGPAYGWCCPTCGNVVEVDDNEYYKTELYPACECGQIIDWSDVLDEYHMKWKRYEVE